MSSWRISAIDQNFFLSYDCYRSIEQRTKTGSFRKGWPGLFLGDDFYHMLPVYDPYFWV